MTSETVVAVVGLGYVGLPLAVHFGTRYPTIGYDVSEPKVAAYREGYDPTGEVSREAFRASRRLEFTSDPTSLAKASFVVAVT